MKIFNLKNFRLYIVYTYNNNYTKVNMSNTYHKDGAKSHMFTAYPLKGIIKFLAEVLVQSTGLKINLIIHVHSRVHLIVRFMAYYSCKAQKKSKCHVDFVDFEP